MQRCVRYEARLWAKGGLEKGRSVKIDAALYAQDTNLPLWRQVLCECGAMPCLWIEQYGSRAPRSRREVGHLPKRRRFYHWYHWWPVCDCGQRAKHHEGNKDVIWLALAWHA